MKTYSYWVHTYGLKVRSGVVLRDVLEVIDAFCTKHSIEVHPMDDVKQSNDYGEITFDVDAGFVELSEDRSLSMRLCAVGQHPEILEDAQALANKLSPLLVEGGPLQVTNLDASPADDEAALVLFVGPNEEAVRDARVRFGLDQAAPYVARAIGVPRWNLLRTFFQNAHEASLGGLAEIASKVQHGYDKDLSALDEAQLSALVALGDKAMSIAMQDLWSRLALHVLKVLQAYDHFEVNDCEATPEYAQAKVDAMRLAASEATDVPPTIYVLVQDLPGGIKTSTHISRHGAECALFDRAMELTKSRSGAARFTDEGLRDQIKRMREAAARGEHEAISCGDLDAFWIEEQLLCT